MTKTIQKLAVFFLFLFLTSPTGPCSAQPGVGSPDRLIITSLPKKPPPDQQNDSQPESSRETGNVIIVKKANVKQKPAGSGYPSQTLPEQLTASNAIVMDGKNGDILYAKAPDQPRQPASTIKVLTGLLAMEKLDDNDKIPISRRASRMPRSKLWLDQGKMYYASDLIDAVLLASANDASVALAEKIAGSEKNFARLMTRKAIRLGAKKTICKSASGLTRRGQCSTVRDLAIIFKKAMENQEFAERIGKRKTTTKEGRTLHNHNKALWKIAGTEGGKTGYTMAAKQTYVGKFKRGGETLVVAIMGSNTMWQDVRNLVEFGFSKIQRIDLADNKSYSIKHSPQELKGSTNDKPGKSVTSTSNIETVLAENKKVATL